jgi:hypothetical protein
MRGYAAAYVHSFCSAEETVGSWYKLPGPDGPAGHGARFVAYDFVYLRVVIAGPCSGCAV